MGDWDPPGARTTILRGRTKGVRRPQCRTAICNSSRVGSCDNIRFGRLRFRKLAQVRFSEIVKAYHVATRAAAGDSDIFAFRQPDEVKIRPELKSVTCSGAPPLSADAEMPRDVEMIERRPELSSRVHQAAPRTSGPGASQSRRTAICLPQRNP